MVTVYSRAPLRSSVWGGHAADGAGHNEAQGVPTRALKDRAFGLLSVSLCLLGFPTWSGNLRRGGGVTPWVAVVRRG